MEEYSHTVLNDVNIHLPMLSYKYNDHSMSSGLSRLCKVCFLKETNQDHRHSRYMLVQGPTYYRREMMRVHEHNALTFYQIDEMLKETEQYNKFICDVCKKPLCKIVTNDQELFSVWSNCNKK